MQYYKKFVYFWSAIQKSECLAFMEAVYSEAHGSDFSLMLFQYILTFTEVLFPSVDMDKSIWCYCVHVAYKAVTLRKL